MDSEKALYWMTLGILFLATATGFFTEHSGWGDRGWGDRLAERSVAVMARASEAAAKYTGTDGLELRSREEDSDDTSLAVVDLQSRAQNSVQSEVQNRLACMQHVLARRQAEMGRLQAMRFQVRMTQRRPRTMVWPNQRLAIAVPQPLQVDTF